LSELGCWDEDFGVIGVPLDCFDLSSKESSIFGNLPLITRDNFLHCIPFKSSILAVLAKISLKSVIDCNWDAERMVKLEEMSLVIRAFLNKFSKLSKFSLDSKNLGQLGQSSTKLKTIDISNQL
jgi:hypothetical protein